MAITVAWCFPLASSPGDAASPVPSRRFAMTLPGSDADRQERAAHDGQLVRRMADGDRAALSELYDRLSRPLYSTALHIVGVPSDAEDIVHDVFLVLWEKAAAFDSDRGSAFSWAVTLTRNRAIDLVRSRRRRAELLEGQPPSDLAFAEDAAPTAAREQADANDDAQMVRAALARLPSDQKQAVELAFFGGLTQDQIAARIQAPLGTVKARIRRGLLKLRDRLESTA